VGVATEIQESTDFEQRSVCISLFPMKYALTHMNQKELKEQTIHVRIAGVDAPEVRWLYK
jgi:hypothetical protein